MTPHELAALLNGNEYGNEITQDLEQAAALAGLVVVFGASDDLMEFRGAIHDEMDAWGGSLAWVDTKGLLPNRDQIDDDEDLKDYFAREPGAVSIEAVMADEEDHFWSYQTSIPHTTFDIVENGSPYCRGIVFSLSDAVQPSVSKSVAPSTPSDRSSRDDHGPAQPPSLAPAQPETGGFRGLDSSGRPVYGDKEQNPTIIAPHSSPSRATVGVEWLSELTDDDLRYIFHANPKLVTRLQSALSQQPEIGTPAIIETSIAQQPAPVVPVGVNGLVAKWRKKAGELYADHAKSMAIRPHAECTTYHACADELEALAQQPAAPSAAVGVDHRKAFEEWVAKNHGCNLTRRADSGEYCCNNTSEKWECWQAALAVKHEARNDGN